ncbi:MAG: penicillin-binding protein 1B [Pseudomonas sp.]|nr:penicillin-binding protein 1B [Pseudomonas sp.]
MPEKSDKPSSKKRAQSRSASGTTKRAANKAGSRTQSASSRTKPTTVKRGTQGKSQPKARASASGQFTAPGKSVASGKSAAAAKTPNTKGKTATAKTSGQAKASGQAGTARKSAPSKKTANGSAAPKKASAAKQSAKKNAATQASSKQTPSKQTSTKQTAAKKAPAKKSSEKKSSAKKPAAKKPATKNTGTGRSGRWLASLVSLTLVLGILGGAYLVYLDSQVRAAFDGKKWALPAKVYARPLALYPGLLLSPEQLESELVWADYRKVNQATRPGTFTREGDEWIIIRRGFPYWDGAEGVREIRVRLQHQRIETLMDDSGQQPLIRLEPQYIGGIFPSHNEDRELVKLDQVPPVLVAALIVTEDQHFFDHWGLSFQGIARALVANVKAGRTVQGGSTLTQQLVKNFFLSNERSLTRKAQEALMSLLLELHYDKEEILETYINEVYLGQSGRRGIHGFGLAARFYFGKPLAELKTSEIATLVGLVKGASFYNPRRHPERAKERRDLILGLMAKHSIISDAERLRAVSDALITASPRRAGQREFPAFLERAKAELQQDYRLQDLQTEGLRVFTTLDPWLQSSVERAAEGHLSRLERGGPSSDSNNSLEVAAVLTSVDGGEIRALLGGRDATYFGFNRALNAQRAIGSLAKPAVFLAALRTDNYHWGMLLDDSPVTVTGQDGSVWTPKNYDGKSHGNVAMADALERSLNQATARLGMTLGLEAVIDEFHRLGVERAIPAYPSLLLGAMSLTPLEVAQLYQTIASEGFLMPLRTIDAVTTGQGEMLSSYAIRGQQVYDPALIAWLRAGLEGVVSRGTAKGLASLPLPLAGKTGTSDDQRDAWFAGFDNRHLGVIWVGYDDNRPMNVTGSSGALPIWRDTFKRSGVEPLTPSRYLTYLPVNDQGELLEDGCSATVYAFPSHWQMRERRACERGADRLRKEIRSWLDWLF